MPRPRGDKAINPHQPPRIPRRESLFNEPIVYPPKEEVTTGWVQRQHSCDRTRVTTEGTHVLQAVAFDPGVAAISYRRPPSDDSRIPDQ